MKNTRLPAFLGLIILLFSPLQISAQKTAFLPYTARLDAEQMAIVQQLSQDKSSFRTQLVTLAPDLLDQMQLRLNLFPDVDIIVDYFDIGNTGISMRSWAGKNPEFMTTAAFVIDQGQLMGHVNSLLGNFNILPLGRDGLHLIIEVEESAFPECGDIHDHKHQHEAEERPSARVDDRGEYSQSASMMDECNIRIVVAYTPAASAQVAPTRMTQIIQSGVMLANTAHANSNVTQRLELAYLYATNDAESDDSVDDVNDLQDDDDGRWDEIHNLRNIYDGDMVGLVTSNAYEDFCGRAYGFDYTDPDNMFQVTEVNCILGNFTFAHEFGHLQGLRHDNDDDTDPFDYAHGFNTLVDFRTIMALNDDDNPSQRINIWSDPDIVFPGTATVAGTSDFNDNSRALNFGESTVIAHRLTPNSITLNETIGDDEYADMVTFEQITAQNFTAENGSMVILRAGDEVRLVPGFHAESGSDGQFFIDGVCTLAPPRPGLVTNDPAPTSRPGDLSTTEPTASLTRTPTLTLFPNPTANQIQLRYELTEEQVVSIQVIDALGASVGLVQAETLRSRNPISDTGHEDENLRETFSPAGVQQKTIDVSSWAPGVYTVIIQTAKGRMVEQFMVIR